MIRKMAKTNRDELSSLLADNEPLMFIDGMIHNYSNVGEGLIEGYNLNPFDIV